MSDFYSSINADMEDWRVEHYFENISREVIGLLACGLGSVSSIFLLLKLNKPNFSNAVRMNYEEYKEYRQKKKEQKQQAKKEKLQRKLNEIEKDTSK